MSSLDRPLAYEALLAVLDTLPVGVCLYEPLGREDFLHVYVNDRYQALKPFRPMIGRRYSEVWPELAELAVPRLFELLDTGARWVAREQPLSTEVRPGVTHTHYYTLEISRVETAEGWLLLNTSTDVTAEVESRNAEQAAKESVVEARDELATTLELMPVGVALVTLEGAVLFANRENARIWGTQALPLAESLEAYGIYRGRDPETGRRLGPGDWPVAEVIATGKSVKGRRVEIERFDGDHATVSISAVPVTGERGEVSRIVVLTEDVSDRERYEEELRRSLERAEYFESVVERSEQPFAEGSPEGGFIYVNDAFVRLTGYSREELMHGVSWKETLTPSEWWEPEARALKRLNETGEPQRYEKEYLRKDGSRVPLEILVHVRTDEKGEITSYYAFATDISQRKRTERQLAEELAATQLLLEASDTLTASIEVDEVMEALTRSAAAFSGRTRVTILMLEDGADTLRLAYHRGDVPVPVGARFEPAQLSPMVREALRDGRPRMSDMPRSELPPPAREIAERFDIRMMLAVPLVSRGRVLGLMTIDEPGRSEPFSQRDVDLVAGLAPEAAVAIENARLLEAEQDARRKEAERAERVTLLKEIAEIGVSSLRVKETGTRHMDVIVDRLGLDSAFVLLADARQGFLEPIAESGLPDGAFERLGPIEIGEQAETARAYRSQTPRFTEDVETDEELSERIRAVSLLVGRRSLATLPLVVGGEPIGVLSMGWPVPRGFTVDEVAFLRSVTAEVALGLQNARLYEERERSLEELQSKDQAIRQAYSDVIDAVTGGRLVILGRDELDEELMAGAEAEHEIREASELSHARAHLRESLGDIPELHDLQLAFSEGVTNMLKHAGGGSYGLLRRGDRVQMVLIDTGPGIDFRNLPKATLVPGFSTQQTLGMGFTLMMELTDRLLLSTDQDGTRLVLEKEIGPPNRSSRPAHGEQGSLRVG